MTTCVLLRFWSQYQRYSEGLCYNKARLATTSLPKSARAHASNRHHRSRPCDLAASVQTVHTPSTEAEVHLKYAALRQGSILVWKDRMCQDSTGNV